MKRRSFSLNAQALSLLHNSDTARRSLQEFSNVSVDAYLKTLRDEKLDVTRLLNSYNHDPKDQNPLYATTQNEFGIKKPTAATYTTERLARNQAFSNSYNSQMPRDQGLNTSLTKSNVQTELNPQFI